MGTTWGLWGRSMSNSEPPTAHMMMMMIMMSILMNLTLGRLKLTKHTITFSEHYNKTIVKRFRISFGYFRQASTEFPWTIIWIILAMFVSGHWTVGNKDIKVLKTCTHYLNVESLLLTIQFDGECWMPLTSAQVYNLYVKTARSLSFFCKKNIRIFHSSPTI